MSHPLRLYEFVTLTIKTPQGKKKEENEISRNTTLLCHWDCFHQCLIREQNHTPCNGIFCSPPLYVKRENLEFG